MQCVHMCVCICVRVRVRVVYMSSLSVYVCVCVHIVCYNLLVSKKISQIFYNKNFQIVMLMRLSLIL